MFSKSLAMLALAALFCPPALALPTADEPGSPPRTTEPSRATEPPQATELNSRTIFQVLLGEIALQRGDPGIAAAAYQDLARNTRDVRVLQRAVEISAAVQQYDQALELLERWTQLAPDDEAQIQMRLNLLLASGRIAELEEPIVDLLKSDPDQLSANFLSLTRLFAQHPDKPAMRNLFARLAARYPDLAEAHYILAVAAAGTQQRDLAHAELTRAQALKPDWEAPLLFRGEMFLQATTPGAVDPDLAAQTIGQLGAYLKRKPESREVRLQLARVLIAARQYQLARQEFDHLLADNPDNPGIIYPVAMLALQEKDFDTARRLFARLLELPFPDQGAVRFFLGQTEEESGNTDQALAYYKLIQPGAHYFSARQRAAYLLFKSDRLQEARALLKASTARTASEKTTLILLEAQLLREAELHAETYALLESALQQQPEDKELLYDTAMAAEKLSKLADMERHLKKLIKLSPDNAHAYNALGYSLADRNLRLPEAYILISKASELAPQDPYIMDSLGWVLYRQGKPKQALKALETAYSIKNDPEIAAHMGEVLWRLGRQEEARELLQKAATASPDNVTLQATLKKLMP
ncbi:MAG: tetratricopeptide repeat protein [Zoogloeaceae bacterium]|jgi:tetratricopeptide (TPR) repeat protein|nr:tetratricopeptide repeat protein [Zoogloeaceae bacterium]